MRPDQRQGQTISPRLQQAVRLLQLSSMDFTAALRDTLGRNPFLECDDIDDPTAGHQEDAAHTAVDSDPATGAASDEVLELRSDIDAETDGDGSAQAASDRDLWHEDAGSVSRRADIDEMSALEMMAVEVPLNGHLHAQLNLLPLTARDLTLARVVVESLDDDGYLRSPLSELRGVACLYPQATQEELQIALKRVQSLEPAGVGARSVAESLMLQLPAIECPQMRALARRIVSDHLQALAARDVTGLARTLAVPPAQVQAACDRIRRLDPRPGWRLGSARAAYVVPDVIVRRVRGQWNVQLNPAVVPKVRLNQGYVDLFQRHRSAKNTELAAHLQEARWTVHNVEQRFSTILDVARAIVRRQRHFLEFGAMAMKPLMLSDIAEEVGVHESTVSRVTNHKYMATPVGVLELKYFFSRGLVSANGSACSGTAIRGLVGEIIGAERPDQPLSDAQITLQLAAQGLVVARRTVTKYRQLLRIEPLERRRRHA
jgi:RNA polymerase sigma-54 factor